MGDEGLTLGPQELSEGMLPYMELDELQTLYEGALRHVPHTGHLDGIHREMDAILGLAAEHARSDVAAAGIDVDPVEARYVPGLDGARYATDDGVLEVGGPGVMDRPYYLETELSHELLHHHLREHYGVDDYTPEEEGVMQAWNLYHADIIGTEDAAHWLEEARTAYNEHDGFPDGFGDTVYEEAQNTLETYHDVHGAPEERMETALTAAFTALTED